MKKFSISVYHIVPVVFGLFSILSFVISFQITNYCFARDIPPIIFLFMGCFVVFLFATIAGYYIIRFIMEPSEKFIAKIKKSSALQTDIEKKNEDKDEKQDAKRHSSDQIEEFSKIFSQVAQAIDVMDAQHLFPDIIGKSRVMRQVLSQIIKVAPTEATVLIQGESGTGKELIAKSIVKQSLRKNKPFISINCAAISSNLMESELFGHERGAFTGATAQKKGCFELAHGGTLFLDEIGDMPLELQVKFLRVLQENSFFRVGGDSPLKVDVRIIAATNKNLATVIKNKGFREDLYYRINVFPVFLPPLRERLEDVELLADYFLSTIAPGSTFEPGAMELLKIYPWPGNIRELENVVERAAVLADGGVVKIRDLPDALKKSLETRIQSLHQQATLLHGLPGDEKRELTLDQTLQRVEKSLICQALKESGGVQVKAATKLGINQRSLWNRIKKFEINAKQYKV